MAKLTAAQVEQLITGIDTLVAKVEALDIEVLDAAQFSEDAIGKSYGLVAGRGVEEEYVEVFKGLFGFAPMSFDRNYFYGGLSKLQVSVVHLFTTNVSARNSLMSAPIEKADWLVKANSVRAKLVKALEKRSQAAMSE